MNFRNGLIGTLIAGMTTLGACSSTPTEQEQKTVQTQVETTKEQKPELECSLSVPDFYNSD